MKTLNNIIDTFRTFAESHKMINTYYHGQTWDFQTKANVYPAMLTKNYVADINAGQTNIQFVLFILDIVNKDGSNKDEIYSDTLLIVQDFVAKFKDDYDAYGFWISDEDVNCDPVEEEFDDILCGWSTTINVTVPRSGNACEVPM